MADRKKPRKVAIFDIDGTIFRSSLLIELVDALVENKIFPPSALKKINLSKKKWLERKGPYNDYVMDVVNSFLKNIKGVPYKTFADVAEEVVEKEKDKTYVYTRDLVKKLKKKNYYLLAVSHSPKTILEPFCKKLGFNKVYGQIYEIGPQNKLTGNVIDLHLIANKANIVKRALEKENLTLKKSIGVGDSIGDVPFLSMVETPICFNPSRRLFRYAKINKWKVVVERKNVVYEIS